MKKICLFTIYVENYGAVLQTYALSTYLRSLKQVERVDIANIYSANVYQLLRKIKSRNPLFTLIKRVMLLPYRHLIKKRYCKEKRFTQHVPIRPGTLLSPILNMPKKITTYI